MNASEIIHQLETSGRELPRHALKEAVSHPAEITPALLKILEYVDENIAALSEDYDYLMHFYALYLLAQFREAAAYPVIVQLFSKPGDIMLKMTDDLVTEDLARILASVSHGDVTRIKTMVENPTLDEYIRSAAIRAFAVLVNEGELSREAALAYFQELFRGKLEREHSNVWNALVVCSNKLYPDLVLDDIKQAYADNLVEEFYIGLNDVEATLKIDMEQALKRYQKRSSDTFITDTINELQRWHYFQQPLKPKVVSRPIPISSKKKIGRNDPCPCGSGRKYKHCCGHPSKRQTPSTTA